MLLERVFKEELTDETAPVEGIIEAAAITMTGVGLA